MMTLNVNCAMDGLAFLSIYVKENIKRSKFDNLMSRNLVSPTKMKQAKAQVFLFNMMDSKFYEIGKL